VQLRNGAANALKQLRDVEQISFQFILNTISEMSGGRSSTGRLFQTRGPWTAKLHTQRNILTMRWTGLYSPRPVAQIGHQEK